LEVRLKASSRKELTRWILSWVPHVKVLGPRELRERLREKLTQALANAG
jgi:predicted DNA-binding transcriptional regulator YafY